MTCQIEVRGKDIFIEKPFAEIVEVKFHDPTQQNENQVRVYCVQYPDIVSFQIRTHKSIVECDFRKKGKQRDMVATVSLSLNELEEIVKKMREIIVL